MTSSKLIILLLLVPVFLGLALTACSDKTFTSESFSVSENALPVAYLPLEQGLRVGYAVLEPETRYFDIEITNPATIAGNPGFTIRKTDRSTGEIETFYRYTKDNAIFESGSTQYQGVRILESPFVVGNSWDRYDSGTDIVIDVVDDIVNDILETNNGDGDINPGDLPKTYPGEGYTTMSIVGFDDIHSLNGNTYGHCLKVAWQTGEYTWNYYWYAAGIGLVKFEQNYSSLGASENTVVGVMTDYQIVKY